MKQRHIASISSGLVALALAASAGVSLAEKSADEAKREDAAKSAKQTASSDNVRFAYVPRGRGAPRARIGGATRGRAATDAPRISALVPEEVGLTLEEQPVLYWYLPSDTSRDIKLTLRDPGLDGPLLRKTLKGPFEAGVQRAKLADHGVKLKVDLPYTWYVSVVSSGEQVAYGTMSGGGIERIQTPEDLAGSLAEAGGKRAAVLAGGGIWYDALDAVSQSIDASPGDADLRAKRAALFEQVGLEEVATAERGSGS